MLLCSYTFRWSHFKTRGDAELTARWFAAWIRMNREQLTCHASEQGPEVTASPRPEYDDFTRSLRERGSAGEKLSAAVPAPLQSAAAAGRLPEDVAPVRPDEGFLLIDLKLISKPLTHQLGTGHRSSLSLRRRSFS
jgi:hypothetical protein